MLLLLANLHSILLVPASQAMIFFYMEGIFLGLQKIHHLFSGDTKLDICSGRELDFCYIPALNT